MPFAFVLSARSKLITEFTSFVLFFSNFNWIFDLFLILSGCCTLGIFSCVCSKIVFSTEFPSIFTVFIEGFLNFFLNFSWFHVLWETFKQNHIFYVLKNLGVDASKLLGSLHPQIMLIFSIIPFPDPSTPVSFQLQLECCLFPHAF